MRTIFEVIQKNTPIEVSERKFKKEKRFKRREDEVTARIINKERAAAGETKHKH